MKKLTFKLFFLMGAFTALLLAIPAPAPAQDKTADPALQALIEQHSQSPCIEDRTLQCLTTAATELRVADLKKTGEYFFQKNNKDWDLNSNDQRLYMAILLAGKPQSAEIILPYIQGMAERIPLFYLTGKTQEADQFLSELSAEEKEKAAYLSIIAFAAHNEVDSALAMGLQTLDPSIPHTQRNEILTQHSNNNAFTYLPLDEFYHLAFNFLTTRLAQSGRIEDIEKIHKNLTQEVKDLFALYYKDTEYSRRNMSRGFTPIDLTALQHGYLTNMYYIAKHLIKADNSQQAVQTIQQAIEESAVTGVSIIQIAGIAKALNLDAALTDINLIERLTKNPSGAHLYRFNDHDIAEQLYEHQFYKEALAYIAHIKSPDDKASALSRLGDHALRAGSMDIVAEVASRLSAAAYDRQYPAALDQDFSKIAVLHATLGNPEKAREAIKIAQISAKEHFKDNPEEYKRNGQYYYKKNTMEYYIISKNTDGLFAFANSEDIQSPRTALIMLLEHYAAKEDWQSYDAILKEKKDLIAKNTKPMYEDMAAVQNLTYTLKADQNRLEDFMQLGYEASTDKESWDRRKYYNLVQNAFAQKDTTFDKEKFKEGWIDNLRPDKKSSTEGTPEYKVFKRYMSFMPAALYSETDTYINTFKPKLPY